MSNAIGYCQLFQPETRAAIFFAGPVDTFGPQSISQPHHINNVPAGIAVLPYSCVGIPEITVKCMAGNFIIKSQAVVAYCAGSRLTESLVNLGNKLRFLKAVLQRFLRSNTGNQAGFRRWQVI